MKPYIAQIKNNLRLMGRDRSVLFMSVLFPMIFFFVFAQSFHGRQSAGAMNQVITMTVIIGVLGSGFFGAGMRAVQDREANILRRFKVTPVGAMPIIVAALVSGVVAFSLPAFLFFFFAKVLYGMPLPHNLLSIAVFMCLGVITFRAMGMIVAAVVNSQAEAQLLINLLYLPMLFLSGATFPLGMMPLWLQKVAQFIPATYLYQGLQSLMIGGETLWANAIAMLALAIAMVVAIVIALKLFRWEKEEKISGKAKLWIAAVLAPFLLAGAYQLRTDQNIEKNKIYTRNLYRRNSVLFQNVRVFAGNGTLIERGAVLIRNGKIAEVFGAPPPNPVELHAEIVDEAGKTLMPGLIDMHVHLGAPGGVYSDNRKYADPKAGRRRLAAYLYSGITAVRSTGDFLHDSLELRKQINSGRYLGAELFVCGPFFTAAGGHPEELLKWFPSSAQQTIRYEFLRQPKTAVEARQQVDALKQAGVDGIKAVLDSGNATWGLFNRLDPVIYDAVVAEAARDNLPSVTHTGSAADVQDAVAAGTNSVEHGSMVDAIPSALFAEMKRKQIAYDPTLSVYEAFGNVKSGDASLLDRSLLEQVGPADLLESTRKLLQKGKHEPLAGWHSVLKRIDENLLKAYHSGVLLIPGSDAGNLLVIHGPTVQHELELWVQAGIPAETALQAATYNAAQVLRASERIGLIQKGRDATFILLDGNPVQDISVTEHINSVYFRGERIERSTLFDQEKE
jgi:imidazolonepropionase-like amidohydrolase/ABC-type multidrug transport system permease subunit